MHPGTPQVFGCLHFGGLFFCDDWIAFSVGNVGSSDLDAD